jgi:MerR family mercuric resistance operon transcriptional regulator
VRTGEVARQAGVNAQTLRYYERRGLLAEPPRSPAGYREYPGSAVRVLRFVKRAQELGFTLDEVEGLLSLSDGGPADCGAVRALVATKVDDLDARIEDLVRMRALLVDFAGRCDLPRADRRCELLDALSEDGPE